MMKTVGDKIFAVSVALPFLVVGSSGCVTTTTPEVIQNSPQEILRNTPTSEEQVVLIAEKEAARRGWAHFETRNPPRRLANGHWMVFLG